MVRGWVGVGGVRGGVARVVWGTGGGMGIRRRDKRRLGMGGKGWGGLCVWSGASGTGGAQDGSGEPTLDALEEACAPPVAEAPDHTERPSNSLPYMYMLR